MSVLRILGEYIHAASYDDLSPEAVQCAKLRLLDYLGTAFHASCAAPWKPLLQVFREYGPGEESTVIGNGLKLPCAWAAMVNTYPHMSEGSRFAGGHCAWIAMPSALAVAERQARRAIVSGKDLILAIVMAYEVMLRIGEAIYPAVHDKGFQPTTARGPIGAAAAASKLLGLDEEVTIHALSIASTMAGGLEAAAFPWPLYCFQTGRATEAGILAALAAEAGLKGNERILEEGFLEAFGDHCEPEKIVANLNGSSSIETTYIKIHFGCRHAHAPVDTCLDLMRRYQLGWQDIEAIIVTTYPTALAICDRTGARTATEAIYDMRTIVALAVVHGDAAMHRFGAEIISSQPVQEVIQRIALRADPEMGKDFPQTWPAIVEIRTRDDRILVHRRDLARGEPEDPLSAAEVEEKFHQLASSALDYGARRELLDLVHALPEQDCLSELFSLLGHSGELNRSLARG